jgi:hypothetical protein
MRKLLNLCWPAMAGCAVVIALSGCSSSIYLPSTSPYAPAMVSTGDPVPRVQNCIAINAVETPARYVCNGKTYTSHELRKLREDAASAAVASK